MKEIKPITSLRGFAAFLVFMYHYAYLFTPEKRGIEFAGEWIPLPQLWQQGQVGVSIFFVLSGFLISRIYFDSFHERTASLRLFLVKRVARIWPLFLGFATIQYGVSWLMGTENPTAKWLVGLSMTQGFFKELRYSGLPTGWSLSIEELYYATAPLTLIFLGWLMYKKHHGDTRLSRRGLLKLTGALLLLIVVLLGAGELTVRLVNRLGLTWNGFMVSRYHMLHATLFGRYTEFAIGIGCALIHRDGRYLRWFAGNRAIGLLIALFAGIGLCMVGKNQFHGAAIYISTYAIALMAGAMILMLAVDGNRLYRILSNPLLVYAGKISYGLYLVQLTVMMEPLLRVSDTLGAARLPVLYLLTSLWCAVSYQLLEVPARRWIVKRWGYRHKVTG